MISKYHIEIKNEEKRSEWYRITTKKIHFLIYHFFPLITERRRKIKLRLPNSYPHSLFILFALIKWLLKKSIKGTYHTEKIINKKRNQGLNIDMRKCNRKIDIFCDKSSFYFVCDEIESFCCGQINFIYVRSCMWWLMDFY